MRLDRNLNKDGRGKYALLNLRTNKVEWGEPGQPSEFFVIKLRDRHAKVALTAYADSIRGIDKEFADQVMQLAERAGASSPYCKDPD